MSSHFDPKVNDNPTVIADVRLRCTNAPEQLVQRPKAQRTGVIGFFKKVYKWFRHPNERIAKVRTVFQSLINTCDIRNAPMQTLANLYANSSYFNQRVIKKHNESWISKFLFWSRVTPLNTSQLEHKLRDLLKACKMDLERSAGYQEITTSLVPPTSLELTATIRTRVPLLHDASQLLEHTKALRHIPEMSEERQQVQMLSIQKRDELSTQLERFVQKMENSSQLGANDLQVLHEIERCNAQMNNFRGIEKLKQCNAARMQSEKRYDQLLARVRDTNIKEDINIQDAVNDKYISADEKEILKQEHAHYVWFNKTRALHEKVLQAQQGQFEALKAEVQQLSGEKQATANTTLLLSAQKKLEQLEKISELSQRWQSQTQVISAAALSTFSAELKAALAITSDNMSSNPIVVATATLSKMILDNIQKDALACAKWRSYLYFKSKSDVLVDDSGEIKNPYDPEVFIRLKEFPKDFEERQAFDAFMKELPEGDEKEALKKLAEKYELLLVNVNKLNRALNKATAILQVVRDPNHFPSANDHEALSILKNEDCGAFKTTFMAAVATIRVTLMEKASARITNLFDQFTQMQRDLEDPNKSLDLFCARQADWESWNEQLDKLVKVTNDPSDMITSMRKMYRRFNRIVELHPQFKEAIASLEKAQKEGGPSVTTYFPGENTEMVTLLGMDHPESKKWKGLILNDYLRLQVAPQLQNLEAALQISSGNDLQQLSQTYQELKTKLGKVSGESRYSQQPWLSLDIRTNNVLDSIRKLEPFVEMNAQLDMPQVSLASIIYECKHSKMATHPFVQATLEKAQRIQDDYKSLDALCKKIDSYQWNEGTEEQLKTILQASADFEVMEAELMFFSTPYPKYDVAKQVQSLQTLKEICAAYPTFIAHRDQFSTLAIQEINACEFAADNFGAGVKQLASEELPSLTSVFPKHPVVESFIKLYQNLRRMRTLINQFAEVRPKLTVDVSSMGDDERTEFAAALARIDIESVSGFAPKLAVNIKKAIEPCKKYVQECTETFDLLEKVVGFPEHYKKSLSLYFFWRVKGKESLYKRTQDLMKHPNTTAATRQLIETMLTKLFPASVYEQAALLEKCGEMWKRPGLTAFNQDELERLATLTKTPGIPLQLSMQLDLIQRMHALSFNPRNTCLISADRLIDPVSTKTKPTHYYDRHALIKSLHTNSTPVTPTMNDVVPRPEIGQLVQEWLLCKDFMRRKASASSFENMFGAYVKSCIHHLKGVARQYLNTSAQVKDDVHQPIISIFISWIQRGIALDSSKGKWGNILLETNELLHTFIFEYLFPSSLPSQEYQDRMSNYVARLYQLDQHLDVLYPKFLQKLSTSMLEDCKQFNRNKQLLHNLLSQPDAFSQENFQQTQQYVAQLLYGTSQIYKALIAAMDPKDFVGDVPPAADDSDAPPPALLRLYVRVYARNHREEVRAIPSYHDYIQHIQRLHEMQNQTHLQRMKNALHDIQVIIAQLSQHILQLAQQHHQQQLRAAQELQHERQQAVLRQRELTTQVQHLYN